MANKLLKLTRNGKTYVVEFRSSISRARNTYGYNVVTASVDGVKVGGANGGGYDLQGAALSGWLETQVKKTDEFSGLTWHDPNYKTPKKVVDREKAGKSFGLERYQAFYAASSSKRTKRHTMPRIEGATGLSHLLNALGFETQWLN